MRGSEFAELAAFVAVAEERSFRRAAARLGLDPSTVSHAISGLEERLGIQLLIRTTRAVSPTEAGESLQRRLSQSFASIEVALEAVNDFRERPAGTVRVTASQTAYDVVLKPLIHRFSRAFPEVVLEVSLEEGYVNILEQRFDAGIRMGQSIAEDMVAVRVSPDARRAIVASPQYLAEHGAPHVPEDLLHHRCVQYRLVSSQSLYRWEFRKGSEALDIDVTGPLILDTPAPMIGAAIQGAGLVSVLENMVNEHIKVGRLVRVLEDWCPPLSGFFLYYPAQRHTPAALRAFIDFLRLRKNSDQERGTRGQR